MSKEYPHEGKTDELIAAEHLLEISPLHTTDPDPGEDVAGVLRSLYCALEASHRRINELERRVDRLCQSPPRRARKKS
jgi:hypothetical protein